MTRIIFVASDFSGLGKGTFSASLGRILRSHGVDTRIMKCDLYYNYDAGTINPGEHGEVYVLADGTETDQDLGLYERFLGVTSTKRDYLTSGQVFHQVYLNERDGKYLGQTVSIEHVIDEIKHRILDFVEQCEVGIVELGATIGDIKGVYFLEACRQLKTELQSDQSLFILLSHFPYLENVHELKTMGCQRSVNDLRSKGIKPDIIIARTTSHDQIPSYQLGKVKKFCEVAEEAVFCFPDLEDEYELPKYMRSKSLNTYVAARLDLPLKEDQLDVWYQNFSPKNKLNIALVGKYSHADAYVSIIHQLRFWGVSSVTYMYEPKDLKMFDAVILPGGWGERGASHIIEAARICRQERIPCLGICLGLEAMAVEYARNVLNLVGATSEEFDENASVLVVKLQEEQKRLHGLGGTARLGNWTTILKNDSKLARIYNSTKIVERHRHRYEIVPDIDFQDFRVVGRDERTGLIEAMELENHPFYLGVQYHPECTTNKSPLYGALVVAAFEQRNLKENKHHISGNKIGVKNKPDTFLENVDLEYEELMRKIVLLTEDDLAKIAVTREQRDLVSKFIEVLDEKQEVMGRLESEISAFELEMRDINIDSHHIVGEALTEGQENTLNELEQRIDQKKQQMRYMREHYFNQLMKCDDAIGEINWQSVKLYFDT